MEKRGLRPWMVVTRDGVRRRLHDGERLGPGVFWFVRDDGFVGRSVENREK